MINKFMGVKINYILISTNEIIKLSSMQLNLNLSKTRLVYISFLHGGVVIFFTHNKTKLSIFTFVHADI